MKRTRVVAHLGSPDVAVGSVIADQVLEWGEPLAHPDTLTIHTHDKDEDGIDCIIRKCVTIHLEDA